MNIKFGALVPRSYWRFSRNLLNCQIKTLAEVSIYSVYCTGAKFKKGLNYSINYEPRASFWNVDYHIAFTGENR